MNAESVFVIGCVLASVCRLGSTGQSRLSVSQLHAGAQVCVESNNLGLISVYRLSDEMSPGPETPTKYIEGNDRQARLTLD